MTEGTYAPGPWNIDITGGHVFITDRENNMAIAKIMHLRQDAGPNARLIASAPELLHILIDLVAMVDEKDYIQGGTELATDALEYARAAIAKATGAE